MPPLDKSAAISTLIEPLLSTYPSEEPKRPHPIDLPHTSRMYKSLLQGGHFSHSAKIVECTETFSAVQFASALLCAVDKETLLAIAKGNGTFVVAELLERVREEGGDEEKKKTKGWFGQSFISYLRDHDVKGKKVLIEKIEALS